MATEIERVHAKPGDHPVANRSLAELRDPFDHERLERPRGTRVASVDVFEDGLAVGEGARRVADVHKP